MPESTQKIRLRLSPQAERYARRDAPRDVRLMASRGALPLPPIELATVLFALMHDPDPEVKSTARESLEGLPEPICSSVLSGETHPAILAHLAHAFCETEAKLEKIALNSAASDDTIAFLASLPFKRIVEIVSNNQDRLLRSSALVEALGENPLTGRSVIDRILAFLGVDPAPVESAPTQDGEDGPISDEAAEAALRAVLGEDMGHLAQELVRETDTPIEEIDSGKLFGMIQAMTVMQKIKLARMGNREARALLIRDRNKLVAMAAVMSPKNTVQDISKVANARNVSDEILRVIARNREWTRDYPVKLALASNPKTPIPEAMKFVNYLHDRDLYTLMRSRDVPTAIATHARRNLMKKGKL